MLLNILVGNYLTFTIIGLKLMALETGFLRESVGNSEVFS